MKATDLPNLSRPVKAWSKKAMEKRQVKIDAILKKEALVKRCLSKRGYKTHRIAMEAAASQMDRINSPSLLRAYCCKDCGMWHLTKKPFSPREPQ